MDLVAGHLTKLPFIPLVLVLLGRLALNAHRLACPNKAVSVRSREKGDEGAQDAATVKDRIVELAKTRK